MKTCLSRIPAFCWMTLTALATTEPAQAVGLGQIHVQSSLGQPLHATIALLGEDGTLTSNCVRARLETSDGAFIARPQAALMREQQAANIVLFSHQSMNEPAMAISLAIDCGMAVHRTYQILLDPPLLAAAPLAAPQPRPTPLPLRAERSATKSAQADLPARRIEAPPARPRPAADAIAEPQQSAGSEKAGRSARAAATASRSVLKLSAEEPVPPHELKLTPVLSAASSQADARQREEIRAAQLHFAALMRDEDPLRDVGPQARSAQERAQILQAEVRLLQEQSLINQAMLEEVRKTSYSPQWIAGLIALLAASLAAIAWLGWRLRVTYKISQRKWWETLTTQGGGQIDDISDSLLLHTTIQPTDFMPTASSPHTSGDNSTLHGKRDGLRGETTVQMPRSWNTDMSGNSPLSKLGLDKDIDTVTPRFDRAEMIKVEEISDVLQQVEFWMLLHDFNRVIEILEPHSQDEKPDSPVLWLYLLDAYGETGNQAKYEELRIRFERHFNARIARWENRSLDDESRGLEDLPHLVEQICVRWGGALAVQFLESLLVDDRDGKRAGFDLPVYRDLMMLIGIANELEQSKSPRHSPYLTA